jgi:hypothetical protein
MKVGIGVGTQRDILSCVKEAAEQARAKLGKSRIDLAILFSSADMSSPSLLKTASEKLGDISVVGCSGAAVISSLGIHHHALAIALISSEDTVTLNTSYVKDLSAKTPFTAGKELSDKIELDSRSSHKELVTVFSDGLVNDSYKFILGLQENFGTMFPMIGGLASDNLRFRKTYQYFNRTLLNDAATGILWGGRFSFGLGIRHGFSPIGKHRIITRGHDNIIETINNKPAVSLYEEYFAKTFSELKNEIRSISRIYPMGIYLKDENEYLIRNVIEVEENGSLVCRGDIMNGATLRMMIGTKERFIEAAGLATEDAKQDLTIAKFGIYEQAPKIDLALVFSSAFRYTFLKKNVVEELKEMQQSLGSNTPILGVYTYGEFGPLKGMGSKGQAYYQNNSIAVLVLGS